jgi:HEAT repeat protein
MTLVVSTCSCVGPGNNGRLIQQALGYIDTYPYRHTGYRPPPQTVEQKKTEAAAQAFVAEFPLIALKAARIRMAESERGATQAMGFLVFHGHRAFEPVFLEQLHRDDFPSLTYARAVIRCLGNIRSARAVPDLIRLRDQTLRGSVIHALGRIQDARAVPFLCQMAADRTTDHSAAGEAARILGRMKDPRAVEPLCDIVDKRENLYGSVRAEATLALAEIGDRKALPVVRRALDRVRFKTANPSWERAPLVAVLALAPESAAKTIRETGNVYLAKYLEPADAIPWLLDVLNDPTSGYHPRAALELARLGVREMVPQIKKELRHPPANAKEYVVSWRGHYLEALFLLGDPEATAIGIKIVGKEKDAWILTALAYHGTREALPLYRSYLAKKNRWGFIGVCRVGKAEDAKGILDYCRAVPWSGKSIDAAFAASEDQTMGAYFPPNGDMPFAIDFFMRYRVSQASPILRKWITPYDDRACAVTALGETGDRSDASWLVDKIAEDFFYCNGMGFAAADAVVKLGDRSVIPRLKEIANRQSSFGGFLALYALARFGEPSALRQIKEHVAAPNAQRGRLRAADALSRLGDRAAYKFLLALAEDTEQNVSDRASALKALTRLNVRPEDMQIIERLASDESLEVCKGALRCLGKHGHPATLRFLRSYPVSRRFDVIDELLAARKELMSKYPKEDDGGKSKSRNGAAPSASAGE